MKSISYKDWISSTYTHESTRILVGRRQILSIDFATSPDDLMVDVLKGETI